MAITIKKVSSKKELKTFIRFNYELYKENPYSVPDLYDDMLNTFSPKKNAAFEFCEAEYFLAYKDNKVVGRIAGIINKRANETWNKKEVRFGWIDFLDDIQTEMATARQFLLIGRCRNLKPEQVFNTANRIEKVVSEQGFETHRMKKAEIKRFLAVYFEASMNGDQMPDTDGEQFFDGEDSDEEEA